MIMLPYFSLNSKKIMFLILVISLDYFTITSLLVLVKSNPPLWYYSFYFTLCQATFIVVRPFILEGKHYQLTSHPKPCGNSRDHPVYYKWSFWDQKEIMNHCLTKSTKLSRVNVCSPHKEVSLFSFLFSGSQPEAKQNDIKVIWRVTINLDSVHEDSWGFLYCMFF
jgi:hypothetical protein